MVPGKTNRHTPALRKFRNHPCHVVELTIVGHNLLHILSEPPQVPSMDVVARINSLHDQGRCPHPDCREPRPHKKKRRG